MSTVTDEQARSVVSSNLSRLLSEKGLTVYWLMKQVDMSPGAMYPIVRGERCPTIATASRIADALGVTVDELLRKDLKNSKLSA